VKMHYHFSIENVVFYALTTALVWHGIRFLSGVIAANSGGPIQSTAHSVGGAFSFPSGG
jgi:hypothetical protein